ncbi:MAG TPA: hypothetical protein VHC67_01585 [Gaiellaceae bacterium]|jgi:hypothetical protein|nr:hypothetical protein [Gaiellaceae bacterium]
MSEHAAATSSRPVAHGLRLSTMAAVLVAVAIGVGAWFLVGRATSSSSGNGTAVSTNGPQAVTAAGLRDEASRLGHDIYWLGPKAGFTYELTVTKTGMAYVRYLPAGVKVGDKRPSFLTVGTYPTKNAYGTVAAARKLKGAQVQEVSANVIAATYASHPHSAYVAWRSKSLVVEIFDPKPLGAQTLARFGLARPAR